MILIQSDELSGDRTVLTDGRALHIQKVLGSKPGDQLRIGLLNGPIGVGMVESVNDHEVVLNCVFQNESPPKPCLDLLLAMPRPKVMKRLWAQVAALGVGRIVLLRAEKVERYYFDSHVLEPVFYNKLLMEGLQQARCTHLPQVDVRPLFKPFVEDELDTIFGDCRKILADPSGSNSLSDLCISGARKERLLLAVGPEGGWTPYELNHLQAHGFELFNMGSRVLRTDTAVVGLLCTLSSE